LPKRLISATPTQRARLPDGRRIYAVGDIHGCAVLLADILNRIDNDVAYRPAARVLQVFLGDYIDRGPDSREVIDLLIARQRKGNVVFLKGNHEDCAIRFLSDPETLPQWKNIGGLNTVASYGVTAADYRAAASRRAIADALRSSMPVTHLSFLHKLALSFTCGDFFFAHAGVRPGIALDQQSPDDLLWIRDDFLCHEESFGKVVVHGHTPSHEPVIRPNRINIDTGAYATGRLTCLVLEGDRVNFL
jgi:serine/threonine protein phosphatase 1